MFQFPTFAYLYRMTGLQPAGLPHSEICGIKGYLHLTTAYRSLSRPSSPPRAKASTVCPYLLFFLYLAFLITRRVLRKARLRYTFKYLFALLLTFYSSMSKIFYSGEYRIRTDDPLRARQVL